MESLWAECAQFVDPSAGERVAQDFPSVFWELYLARELRAHGIAIVSQAPSSAPVPLPDAWFKAGTEHFFNDPELRWVKH